MTESPGAVGAASREPKLALHDVWKRYKVAGDTPRNVLQGVHLAVQSGEFVALVGHSGCGKSTILNMIAGYIKPDRGDVLVDGRTVEKPGPDRGVVFQEHALFPWYSVLDNVAFGPLVTHHARSEAMESARAYLRLVGLEAYAKAYPDTLSGGMKQRVGIARALANKPSTLLMDEPFGALDALTRDSMRTELLRIWLQLRPTVVFVTHSVPEAVYLSDHVAVMKLGEGTIHRKITIDLPRPRDTRSVAFLDYVDTIESYLNAEQEALLRRE